MSIIKDKKIISWALYDWANSAFVTTVIAGFFPIFFKQYLCKGMEITKSTAILGFANSLAGIIIALSSPILGAIADSLSAKKKFLAFFTYLGILMTFALALVEKGNWQFGIFVFIIGSLGFSGSLVFYDALLLGISNEKNVDFVSALGYSLGYLGGGLLFAFNVLITLHPEYIGLSSSLQAIKISFITVAVWWGLFSLPLFFFVPESSPSDSHIKKGNILFTGFQQLSSTLKKAKHLKVIFLFLFAYWFYIDGVDSIIRMAIDYGLSIGLASADLIKALLITQFVGFPSALLFGKIGEKYNARKGIFLGIFIYIGVVIWGMKMTSKYEFYILAGIIGFAQGGIQALSRSFYIRLIPPSQAAEFFGFYNFLGKTAVMFGPLVLGLTNLITKNSRLGIGSLMIFFIIGGSLFYFVDEKKGREEVKHLAGNNTS